MKQIAEFSTARGPQLLASLTKHFGHKIKVETQDDRAQLHFEMGEAVIETIPDGLRLTADATGEDNLQQLRDVLESHLLRFAFREDPQPLNWNTPGS